MKKKDINNMITAISIVSLFIFMSTIAVIAGTIFTPLLLGIILVLTVYFGLKESK